jgi:hypothetical protein
LRVPTDERMRIMIGGVSLALSLSCLATTAQEPVILVRRATVIAFFQPVTEQELAKDGNLIDALADFQHYAAEAREPLRKAGVDFHEVYARSFQLREALNRNSPPTPEAPSSCPASSTRMSTCPRAREVGSFSARELLSRRSTLESPECR